MSEENPRAGSAFQAIGAIDYTVIFVRAIGVLEVLGALGLVLPPLAGIAVGLALAAAIGLVLVQIGGIILHLNRGATKVIGLNIALLLAAGVLVWLATVRL